MNQATVEVQIKAATRQLEQKLRVIAKHLTALADELSAIDAGDPVDSDPGGVPER